MIKNRYFANTQAILLFSVLCLSACTGQVPTLGVKAGALMACPAKENCVNSQASAEEYAIAPLISNQQVAAAKAQLLKVLRQTDRVAITVIEDNYIRAEFTSSIMRFVDDVEFYFPDVKASANTNQTIIHVRSASRLGESDFGVNRERVEAIRGHL